MLVTSKVSDVFRFVSAESYKSQMARRVFLLHSSCDTGWRSIVPLSTRAVCEDKVLIVNRKRGEEEWWSPETFSVTAKV